MIFRKYIIFMGLEMCRPDFQGKKYCSEYVFWCVYIRPAEREGGAHGGYMAPPNPPVKPFKFRKIKKIAKRKKAPVNKNYLL